MIENLASAKLCLKCLADGLFTIRDKCSTHERCLKRKRLNLKSLTPEQKTDRRRELARLRRMRFTPEQVANARERHLRSYERNRELRMQRMREWYEQNKSIQQEKNRARYAQARDRSAADATHR